MTSLVCPTCNKKTGEKDNTRCNGCGRYIHSSCTGLSSSAITVLKENVSLKFTCLTCMKKQNLRNVIESNFPELAVFMPELLSKVNEIKEYLQSELTSQLTQLLKVHCDKIEQNIISSLRATTHDSNTQRTFAQVVGGITTPAKDSVVTVTPKCQQDPARGTLRSGRQRQLTVPLTTKRPIPTPTVRPSRPITKPLKSTATPSQTNVTAPKRKPRQLTQMERTVIIKPVQNQDACVTRDEIQSNLNPVELEVKDFRSLPSGDVLVRCASASSALQLSDTVNRILPNRYETEIKAPLKPRIKISGLSEDIDADNIIPLLRQQNNIPESAVLKIVRITKSEGKDMFAIIEPDAQTFGQLLRIGRVNLGWNRCRVTEQINVRRCFRCSEFGHIANTCTKPHCCPKCSENHSLNECSSSIQKCGNCMIANTKRTDEETLYDIFHSAWSSDCPAYAQRLRLAKQRIDYTT
ncbi:uncharacterized protein LOC129738022 [Uranotaenia lowii]|uniref:uncharacterized protein LOC129738022 n=1 Tax=Uranotaenia lowii TaxID=190385 RepID=UPI00247B23BC|nr:uncharacterized protein LOC129738022 [Uranotaenia lowii]